MIYETTHRFTKYSIEFAVLNTVTGEIVSDWHFGSGARTDVNALVRTLNAESAEDVN